MADRRYRGRWKASGEYVGRQRPGFRVLYFYMKKWTKPDTMAVTALLPIELIRKDEVNKSESHSTAEMAPSV